MIIKRKNYLSTVPNPGKQISETITQPFATKAPLDKLYSNVKLKLVIDKTSIEIFFNDGEKVLTEIFFPSEHFSELDLSTDTKGSTLNISGHQ